MPRNMSFSMTTEQMRNTLRAALGLPVYGPTKGVTRRLGWQNVEPGQVLNAIVKGRGLRKGEKVERICQIEVFNSRRERIDRMLEDHAYGIQECKAEGFPDMVPDEFVDMFCKANKCKPHDSITRIAFNVHLHEMLVIPHELQSEFQNRLFDGTYAFVQDGRFKLWLWKLKGTDPAIWPDFLRRRVAVKGATNG